MKKKLPAIVRLSAVQLPGYEKTKGANGAYTIQGPLGRMLTIICSDEEGWDHISVSVAADPFSTPTWSEMEHVKHVFFEPGEVAMQLHVADADHINNHPGVLHLWRPQSVSIPLPPKEMV